jgi:FK506-binding protein 4/5
LEIDGKNIKALFRRGIAYSESGDWNEAKADFMKCLEMEPENKDVKKELTLLKRKIAEQNAKDKKAYAGMFEKLAAKPQKSK